MHETCDFEAFLTNVLELLRIFMHKYFILIGLEETKTAVYTCSLKPSRTCVQKLNLKGLGVHETCDFEAFFTNVLELLRSLKPIRTIEN